MQKKNPIAKKDFKKRSVFWLKLFSMLLTKSTETLCPISMDSTVNLQIKV